MKIVAIIGLTVTSLLLLVGLGWFFAGNNLEMYQFFAPKQEAARRSVFEKSKAYNQGMIQELQNMQFEYIKAAPEHQDALAGIILHRAADFNQDELPSDLRAFISELKSKQGRN